ncbi:MAG: hypothetical protein ABI633_05240 [Burkholderiales bacterium]
MLEGGLQGVKHVPQKRARHADGIAEYDFLGAYIADLANAVDFETICAVDVNMGVDPLGGAGVHYWAPIADRYKLDLSVVSENVDPRFAFMSVDWDGQIRMDPSSRRSCIP